jgi:hypothetical protein
MHFDNIVQPALTIQHFSLISLEIVLKHEMNVYILEHLLKKLNKLASESESKQKEENRSDQTKVKE